MTQPIPNGITAVPGIRVGYATDSVGLTRLHRRPVRAGSRGRRGPVGRRTRHP